MAVLATLAVGAAGGGLFAALDVPLAWLLGALVATGLAGRFAAWVRVPQALRNWTVPIIGVLVGSAFTPDLVRQIPQWLPGLAAMVGVLATLTALGTIYFRYLARFDRVTAFFAALPGGLSEITLIGASIGGRLAVLAIVHTMRIIAVVATVPFALRLLWPAGTATDIGASAAPPLTPGDALTIAVTAALGAAVGRALRLPAAGIIGPMALSAATHLAGWTAVVPPGWLLVCVQVAIGSYIGARFVAVEAAEMRAALLHGAVWGVAMVAIAIAAAWALAPMLGLPRQSLLLGFAPGGVAEMALVSLSLGVDIAFVSSCHLIRILCVYAVTPVAVRFLSRPAKGTSPL